MCEVGLVSLVVGLIKIGLFAVPIVGIVMVIFFLLRTKDME